MDHIAWWPVTRRIPLDVAAQVSRLFTEEAEAVFRAALRAAHDRCEAEDLVQETFQTAALQWRQIVAYSPDKKRAWLCRVAIYKAIDRYRIGKRMHLDADTDVSDVSDVPWVAPSAEEVVLARIEKDRCLRVINEMPPKRRIVAYLRWREEWTIEEIAEELGMAASTVRVHLHNARAMLETALADEVSVTEEQMTQTTVAGRRRDEPEA